MSSPAFYWRREAAGGAAFSNAQEALAAAAEAAPPPGLCVVQAVASTVNTAIGRPVEGSWFVAGTVASPGDKEEIWVLHGRKPN